MVVGLSHRAGCKANKCCTYENANKAVHISLPARALPIKGRKKGTYLDTYELFMIKRPQQGRGMNEIPLKALLYYADSQKYSYKFSSHEEPQTAPSYLATRYRSTLENLQHT